jgi:ABC-type sulfate transport system permease component
MAVFAWVMLGLAIWHFTIFIPDRFWSGIVGAFIGALIGCVLSGWILSGFALPGRDDTDLVTVLYAVPGTLVGLAVVYAIGVARERGDASAA